MSSTPTGPPPLEGGKKKVTFVGLFRFATTWDLTLTFLGCVAAAGQGVIFPCFSLIFGTLLSSFNSPTLDLTATVNRLSLYFLIISLCAFVCGFLQVALTNIASENQIRRLRIEYLKALLRLPPSWHDVRKDQGEVSSRLTTDTMLVQSGLGEKMTGGIQHSITFFAGLAVGFYTSWQLTLTILGCTPLLVGVLVILKNSISKFEEESSAAYAKGGDACTETLSLIRTVSAYGGEKREIKRYQGFLMGAESAGIRKGFILAGCVGAIFGVMFLMYAIAMAVGSTLILASRAANPQCRFDPTLRGCFSGGDVIQCFMAVLLGAFSLGQAGPNLAAIASAQGAAGPLFEIIDEVPLIDVESSGVLSSSSSSSSVPKPSSPLPSASGKIEFRRVTFRFPSRPEQTILSDFSLVIAPGETLALVGESGSGKSTLIQLILRFYDVESGAVLVDEVDVRAWDVKKLREKMGYVSQEPLLFATSVQENIAMGVQGKEVTRGEIEAAAIASSSHGFITTLPSGYATVVGTSTSSTQLSGGQRQRLCIARSLIRDPQILLLDEATSALDNESERQVQLAIDNLLSASGGTASGFKRTAVVIAHRLSTIINADMIVVLSKGKVVESGKHTDLIAKPEGMYAALWALQDVGAGGVAAASALAVRPSSLTSSGSLPLSQASSSSTGGASGGSGSGASSSSSSPTSPTSPPSSSSEKSKGPSENVWDAVKDTTALPPVSRFRVWALQSEDALIMALALVGSAGSGIVQPVFGLIYSKFIVVFFDPSDQTLREKTGEYCGVFVAIAIAVFLCTALRIGGFTVMGERLTRKLRVMSYRAVLRQPMAFFDAPENSVGRLNTRLAADAADVKSGTGETVGQAFQAGAAIIAAAVIAFMASWRLALVVLSVMPLQVIGAAYGNQAFVGFSLGGKKALEESGHLAVEAMAGLRTVAAYGLQGQIMSAYTQSLVIPHTAGVNKALSSGVAYGFSAFMMFSVYALSFYVGGVFISQGLLDFSALMQVFLAVTMASQAVGSAMAWGPDQAKAAAATKSIFALLDKQSTIDPMLGTSISGEEEKESPLSPPSAMLPTLGGAGVQGCSIEFKEVSFSYPTRPGIKVLDKFNLKVKAGEAVGVVGSSGSGKSTLIALLERWYDVDEGDILLDGVSIRSFPVQQLRASLALVQQQPDLFCDSVGYNIGYSSLSLALPPNSGVPLEQKVVVEGEEKGGKKAAATSDAATTTITISPKEFPPIDPLIVQAASSANALSFIQTFEHQFHTHVGVRGGQLSGGQRQRVAIARAILRESRVMLFDEATAALDSESERVVQESLDALVAKGGQTKIIIAHRLSTVKQCGTIVVLEKGVIAEAGTHEELWALNGVYRRLAAAQEKEAI